MLLAMEGASALTERLVGIAAPWSKVYSNSTLVSAGVLFLHLAPLVFGAGAAFAADRATIRVARGPAEERVRQLGMLSATHRLVVAGLAMSVASGLLLFLADVETFVGSVFFWIKLACVGLLLVNGFVMTVTEKALSDSGADEKLWGRLRTLAIVSAVLWLATTLAGVVLKEFA